MIGSQRVAAGILASRTAGLIREIVINIALGVGPITDAFRAAMRIPNLLQNLLGEGSISAAFVPVYASLVEEGREEEAKDLTRRTLAFLSVTVAGAVALIVLFARPLVWMTTLGSWSGERYELTITLTRITALGAGFLVLSAWCLGILNAHRHYFLSYTAPVIWSGAQIIGLTAALIFDVDTVDIATWGAVAMVIGSVGQFVVQLPTVKTVGGLSRPQLRLDEHLRTVLHRFVPAVGGRGVVQLSSYVDLALASLLAAGALATLLLVMPLYLLAIAVFGFSVAVSELTEMSRTRSGLATIAARVRSAQRRVLLPGGMVTAGAIGGGAIVIGTLYEQLNRLFGGSDAATSFTSANTTVAAATLGAFALGLPATMVARVTQNALYSLGDVKGPARIAVARLVISAVVGFFCMVQLDHLAAGSLDDIAALPQFAGQSGDELVLSIELALGAEIGDGPGDTITVDGFPHWPPWELLPNRESLFTETEDGSTPMGTPFIHYGAAGLGLGSAVASWVEWALLRRRLQFSLIGQTISTGLGRWVAIAGFASFVVARGVDAIGLPPVIDLIILCGAVLGTYIGSLWFMGLQPRRAGA